MIQVAAIGIIVLLVVYMCVSELRARRRHELMMARIRTQHIVLGGDTKVSGYANYSQDGTEDTLMPVMDAVKAEVEPKPVQIVSVDTGTVYPKVTPLE